MISTSRRDLFRFKHVEKVLLFSFSCMFLAFLDCKGFSEETHKLVMGKETGSMKHAVLQIIETYTAKNNAFNWHTFGQQYSQKSS